MVKSTQQLPAMRMAYWSVMMNRSVHQYDVDEDCSEMFACAGVTQISVSTMMLQKSIRPSIFCTRLLLHSGLHGSVGSNPNCHKAKAGWLPGRWWCGSQQREITSFIYRQEHHIYRRRECRCKIIEGKKGLHWLLLLRPCMKGYAITFTSNCSRLIRSSAICFNFVLHRPWLFVGPHAATVLPCWSTARHLTLKAILLSILCLIIVWWTILISATRLPAADHGEPKRPYLLQKTISS